MELVYKSKGVELDQNLMSIQTSHRISSNNFTGHKKVGGWLLSSPLLCPPHPVLCEDRSLPINLQLKARGALLQHFLLPNAKQFCPQDEEQSINIINIWLVSPIIWQ